MDIYVDVLSSLSSSSYSPEDTSVLSLAIIYFLGYSIFFLAICRYCSGVSFVKQTVHFAVIISYFKTVENDAIAIWRICTC